MKNKDIIACGASLYRVLNVADGGTMFVMDCLSPKMPFWTSGAETDCKYVTEQELYERTGKVNTALDDLDAVRRRVALNRYTIIAGVLPFLSAIKEQIETAEQESTDYDSNKNLNTGINVTFSLTAHNCNLCGRHCGLNLISKFLKHKHYLKLSFN